MDFLRKEMERKRKMIEEKNVMVRNLFKTFISLTSKPQGFTFIIFFYFRPPTRNISSVGIWLLKRKKSTFRNMEMLLSTRLLMDKGQAKLWRVKVEVSVPLVFFH